MAWQPPPDACRDVIMGQNPWWELDRVPEEFAKQVPRHLGQCLHHALTRERKRYQLILGPRRVGKTTALYQTIAKLLESGTKALDILWLTLNVPYLMEQTLDTWVRAYMAGADPTQEKPLYIFLDEVNYADKWDLWLKTFYDEQLPVRIVATSSSTAALRDRQFESGVGRWEEQFLPPCLLSEYLELRGIPVPQHPGSHLRESLGLASWNEDGILDLEQHRRRFLLIGGFPELILAPDAPDEASDILRSQQTLRSDAIQRAVGMDIPQAFNVNEPIKLEKLLYVLAGQIGGLIRPTTLATDVGLSAPTIHQYLDYLEKAYLILLLPNYSATEESIQRRGRKVYFVDGAVRNAALYRGIGPLTDHSEMGVLFENAVAAHLHALALQTGVRLFHWRQNQLEVDFIYDHPTHPVAIEVSHSPNHSLSGLTSLCERHPRFRGGAYLVTTGSTATSAETAQNGIGRVPFDRFLLTVGSLARSAMDVRLGL